MSSKRTITYFKLPDGSVLEMYADSIIDEVYISFSCQNSQTSMHLPLEFLARMSKDLALHLQPKLELLEASDTQLMAMAVDQAKLRLSTPLMRKMFHMDEGESLEQVQQELYTWLKEDQRRLRERLSQKEDEV